MTNSNVAHAWANQTKDSGKGSSFFFEGKIIYSYGYHFKVAEFITIGDNTFVAYNYSNYSSTTNKHQGHVRNAIPSYFDIIKVIDMNFGYYGHKNNFCHYILKINEHFAKAQRSNKYKDFQIRQTKGYINTLHEYIRLFKINLFDYAELLQDLPKYALMVDEYENSDTYKNWVIKQETKKIEENKKQLIEQAENIVKFREFKVSYVYSLPYNLLRYNEEKNEIQTSGGVNMAKDIFVKYYNKLINNQLIDGEKIEHFRYGGQKDNIVFVGCHRFELSEIENLINKL
jgi:hypothetical protein